MTELRALDIAQAWAEQRKLQPTKRVVDMAMRRICACGRLSMFLPFLSVDSIVRVRTYEFGQDLVPHGTVVAHVWVAARDAEHVQIEAGKLHRIATRQAWPAGLMIVPVVHEARRRDVWLARLRWLRFRRGRV